MHLSIRTIIYCLFFIVPLSSCLEEADPASESEKFIRFFDHGQFSSSFKAIDIIELPSGGYLVLAGRAIEVTPGQVSYQGVYLLKTDQYGNFVGDLNVEESYINALPGITEVDGKYYFICTSTEGNYMAQLASVDINLEGISFSPLGLSHPGAVAPLKNINKDFIVLSYNPADKQSVVSIVSTSGMVTRSASYSIGAGNDLVDEKIHDHFAGTGRIFPFQVGEVSPGLYFFNGFYDYSLSLAFVNLNESDNKASSVIRTEYDDVGFSTVVPIGGNVFATSLFNQGDNFLYPRTTLATSSGESSIEFEGAFKLPELAPYSPVKILRTQLNEKNVLVYGSNTKSKQIGLFFYDETTGALLGNRYVGFSNPFEIGNVIKTLDGGLAIAGTTYIAGRFARVTIIKLSKDEVEKEVK
ncbi:MAG TPA: hypothetical protein VD884_14780 [Ohtaekwangia sp.]|nr:hypothetical protein [Ohtaekwangia sp.]